MTTQRRTCAGPKGADEWTFRWKRLLVCLLVWRYFGFWPMDQLTDAEWREQLDGETARDAFLEGWCRE